MLPMGNFVIALTPQSVREDIGFFPFRAINTMIFMFEEAPTDTFIIPANSNNRVTFPQYKANSKHIEKKFTTSNIGSTNAHETLFTCITADCPNLYELLTRESCRRHYHCNGSHNCKPHYHS